MLADSLENWFLAGNFVQLLLQEADSFAPLTNQSHFQTASEDFFSRTNRPHLDEQKVVKIFKKYIFKHLDEL
jgi:hypothetical protein